MEATTSMTDQIATTDQDLASFVVVGIAARVRNAEPAGIGAAWAAFFARDLAAALPTRTSDDIFAIYTEYESDATGPYTLVIGYQAPAAAAGGDLRAITVPAGRYTVLTAAGEQPAATLAAWQRVWASDLDRAYTVDFDRHEAASGGQVVRVHVARSATAPAVSR